MASTPVFKFILSIFFSSIIIIPTFSCPIHQKHALLHFKSTLTAILNDTQYLVFGLDSWNSSSDCCSWELVNCSGTGSVTELHLSGVVFPLAFSDPVSIFFEIWSPIFHIRSLELLDISSNYLEGEIPGDGFGNLTKLLHLDMRHNNFNGSIPSQLLQLTNLRYLDMSQNFLEGKLGPELGSFRKLTTLRLSNNRFQGPIPAQLFELESLRDLDLSRNNLGGSLSPEIGKLRNLKALKQLNISHNKISGNIPLSLGNLVSIESLDVSHNELSGSIPQSLDQLGNLTVLDVSNNMLTGKIPRGRKMDTMDELSYFQNNSGLCGMQIKIECPEDIPSLEGSVEEEEDLSWTMFWEGTWIGFPIGFFSTILTMGYLLNFLRLFKFW